MSELARRLRLRTPARVALAQCGVSLATAEQLDFQRAHALARDAVHARLEVAPLLAALRELAAEYAAGPVLALESAVAGREEYLRRPDLGRVLSERSRALIPATKCDVAIALADGLSALAAERYALPVLRALLPRLCGLRLGLLAVVEQGRVAISDEIGAHAKLMLLLVGERPGLSAPDSLGAYLTYAPRTGRTDAERNCISNIREGGLQPEAAAERIAWLVHAALRAGLTGVALKEDRMLP